MYLPAPLRDTLTAARRWQANRQTKQDFRRAGASIHKCDFVAAAIKRAPQRTRALDEKTAFDAIETRRQELLQSSHTFDSIDYGRGFAGRFHNTEQQLKGVRTSLAVSEATTWTQDPIEGRLLYHLVRLARPAASLELGTCVGISGSYIASGLPSDGKHRLWTLEGSPGIAAIAKETFSTLGLSDRVSIVTGPFRETLHSCLDHGPFGFAFIDGHHEGAATLRYFEQIKTRMFHGGVMVFDDIDYAPDMMDAWNTIAADNAVMDKCTVSHLGIVVMK